MAIEEYRDPQGNIRMLARLEPRDEHMKMRASMLSLTDYLAANGEKLMAESEYVDVDVRDQLGAQFGSDQHSSNGCTGFTSAGAMMEAMALHGHDYADLSGAYIYSQINGGHDAGSVITDAAVQLRKGVCRRSLFDFPNVFPWQVTDAAKSDAPRFRAAVIVTVGKWAEVCHAAQKRWPVIYPMCVGGNYDNYSNEGVVGFQNGPGNHAVHAIGMKKLSIGWALLNRQSWYPTWGPFKNGYYFVSRNAVEAAGMPDDGYAIIDVAYDSQDPNLPPAPVN